jgi:hypothetical protein
MQFPEPPVIAEHLASDKLKMQTHIVADRIAATARMLVSLYVRLAGAASEPMSSTEKRLQEAIADLTRLELKLRGRRWHAPQDVPDR